MDNMETVEKTVELQKIVQKLEKLEKMINPNSKKSLILWEEDDGFKKLISTITEYATTCDVTDEFPVELLDKLTALKKDAAEQIEAGATKVEELKAQAKENLRLSEVLSTVYVSAMAGNPISEYEDKISSEELAPMKEYLETISTSVPETEEYVKAEKAVKSKISNLENSVHITIDLERTVSKGGALTYITEQITPAVERLQTEYDAKYGVQETATTETGEEVITALAIRKTFSEKVYDAIVKPFASLANLFKRKSKVK
ncbi:MAG: hypothetical protein IJ217_04440 [Clostridia bacterium]|nr:hypothetical protein [Clostridia bacterium]